MPRALRTSLFTILLCAPLAAQEHPAGLAPLAFLVGVHDGTGALASGPEYREELTGEWSLGGSAIVVRSRSRIGERTVFEDLRVITWDPAGERARMRQFANGWVATYTITVGDGEVVFDEVAYEGPPRAPWRYRVTPQDDGGFRYRVDAGRDDAQRAAVVAGTLLPRLPDPSAQGARAFAQWRAQVPRAGGAEMAAVVHAPEGDGPFPVVVFSPGGDAASTAGYDTFGKWWASWGFVTVICAFGGDAATRAARYPAVVDWLQREHEAGERLRGKLDLARVVAAGHSSGGHAAVLASRAEQRFAACLAIAPAGPTEPDAGEHRPETLLVVGTADDFAATVTGLFDALGGPRRLVTIDGMDHMFHPTAAYRQLLARSTAFLLAEVAGQVRLRELLDARGGGVTVRRED